MHSMQMKGWILKHACKYRMTAVINQIFSKTEEPIVPSSQLSTNTDLLILENICQASSQIPSIYPVMALLWLTVSKIRDPSTHQCVPLLRTAIELLEHTYSFFKSVPFEVFLVLIHRLKIMVLLQSVRQVNPDTAPLLNKYFPLWSHALENKLKLDYQITKTDQIEAIRNTYKKCRMLVINWMINKEKFMNYYQQFLKQELDSFIVLLEGTFHTFWEGTVCRLPLTEIEQIINGTFQEFENSDDPMAFQYLCESLALHCIQTDDEHNLEEVLLNVLQFLARIEDPTNANLSENSAVTTCKQTIDCKTPAPSAELQKTPVKKNWVPAVPLLEKHLPDVNLKPCLIMFGKKESTLYRGQHYDLYT